MAKRIIKRTLIVLLILLVVIQFFHPAKNIATAKGPNDITNVYTVPSNVESILEKACYDCHSDNTRYPWYNNIQPVAWWLANHIHEGKHELNFSQIGTYTKKRQIKKFTKIAKSVNEGWMPLSSYLWIHRDAVLSKEEAKAVADWANNLAEQLTIDSTKRP